MRKTGRVAAAAVSLASVTLAACSASALAPTAGPAATPPCDASALSLAVDQGAGAYDGMSHAGARLSLTNRGATACRVDGLPRVGIETPSGAPADAAREAPIGMHPGPVVLPVTLAPGASATTLLRWVSGPVFGGPPNRTPVGAVTVAVPGGTLRHAMGGAIFARPGAAPGFQQTVLHLASPTTVPAAR